MVSKAAKRSRSAEECQLTVGDRFNEAIVNTQDRGFCEMALPIDRLAFGHYSIHRQIGHELINYKQLFPAA